MSNREVVSAFLDNEPFDPAALSRALADPEGRELLLDLIALRSVVQDEPPRASAPPRRLDVAARSRWIAAGFLAASLIFGAGAAWLLPPLLRQQPAAASDVPPRPDRVITVETSTGDVR